VQQIRCAKSKNGVSSGSRRLSFQLVFGFNLKVWEISSSRFFQKCIYMRGKKSSKWIVEIAPS